MYLYTFLWAPKLRNMTKSCQMEVLPQDSEVYSLFRAGGTHDGVIGVIPIFARIIGKKHNNFIEISPKLHRPFRTRNSENCGRFHTHGT